MASRLELQAQLETILGVPHVYFQPPASVRIEYPAIVYGLDAIENTHADDGVYVQHRGYWILLIDKNPDCPIVDTIAKLPLCRFDRWYPSDNLNHWRFLLYF